MFGKYLLYSKKFIRFKLIIRLKQLIIIIIIRVGLIRINIIMVQWNEKEN